MKPWLRRVLTVMFLAPWVLGVSECNTFSGSSNKTTDAALMFQAQQDINKQDYSDALTTLASLSSTAQTSHDGLILIASAHAGVCGLNLVNLAEDVANLISSKTIMEILLADLKGATSNADCSAAETALLSIPAASMTSDDYIFLAFLEFAKIGADLEISADGGLHTGTAPVSFTSCPTTPLTDALARDVGISLNIALSAINSSGISVASALTSTMQPLCASPVNFPCSTTDPTVFSALQVKIIRTLIQASEVGLNTCGGASTSLGCICP